MTGTKNRQKEKHEGTKITKQKRWERNDGNKKGWQKKKPCPFM
jgi:hypothetical protein